MPQPPRRDKRWAGVGSGLVSAGSRPFFSEPLPVQRQPLQGHDRDGFDVFALGQALKGWIEGQGEGGRISSFGRNWSKLPIV